MFRRVAGGMEDLDPDIAEFELLAVAHAVERKSDVCICGQHVAAAGGLGERSAR